MRKVFRFEFAYLLKRISTWLYLSVLVLFTLLMNMLTTPGDGVHPNNTFHIIAMTIIGGLIWLIMGASTAGEAAARDVKLRMHLLTFTTPLKKFEYLGGKFLAALAVNGLLILALPLGVLLSFYLPGLYQEGMLPFRPSVYLTVYFLIALPNVFIATAFQFTFAILSRQVLTSYLASLILAVVAQIIAVSVADLFSNWDLVKLLDPVGVAGIVGNEMATWTPTEKNTRLVTLDGMFLWNRVLWMSVAVALLFLTYLRFKFEIAGRIPWRKRLFNKSKRINVAAPLKDSITNTKAISIPHVYRSFNFTTSVHQTLTIAWASFQRIARSPIGISLIVTAGLVSVIFASRIMTVLDIPLLPTTQQVLGYLTPSIGNIGSAWVIIPLLIIYFSGELVWHERDAGINDIADATPVSDWVLFSGKFIGLSLTITVWVALLMATGIAIQVQLGYDKFQIGLYLQTLFGLQLINYLLFAALTVTVHVVVNQKYIGYLLMILVVCFMSFPSAFGVEHNLLIFGSDPGWSYTDMRGFGQTLFPWLWFKLYWIGWALLLLATARILWSRGRERSLGNRLHFAKTRLWHLTKKIAFIAPGMIILIGGYIFYNTNVLNDYATNNDVSERSAAYERLYSQYKNSLQPQLTATKLQIELYPEKQKATIHGDYTLTNKSAFPIDSIHLGSVSGRWIEEVTFNRVSVNVFADKKHSHQIYSLKQPLLPGDSLQLSFKVNYHQSGFAHKNTDVLIIKNGTYFTNFDLLPSIGYQPVRELQDPVLRKKHKLTARPAIASLYDSVARKKSFSNDHQTLEVTIGTANDEVAIAPGALQKKWKADNRNYYTYKTEGSVGAEYSILSSRYALKESKWNNVVIKIYHHPAHDQNISRMISSVTHALQYYTAQFGPYPYKYITLVEQAGSGAGATADAGIIYYGEQYAMMKPDDSPNGFDLPYYIIAHEVAHQWWGMARLTPANVAGAGVLIEGLAVYSGMQVLEKHYGDAHLRKYLGFLHSFYAMPRSLASANLLEADESFLYYRKGGLAMYVLSKYIGKEKVNGALQNLLRKRDTGELTLPTSLDLYNELIKATPDSFQYLLNDLFKKNMYWRLKTKSITAIETKKGNWQVSLHVDAQKIVVDHTGKETEVPMNDLLEIGLYEEVKGSTKPLYLKLHRIRSGAQTIIVTVPKKPDSGGIDPNLLMIDLRQDDNVVNLEESEVQE